MMTACLGTFKTTMLLVTVVLVLVVGLVDGCERNGEELVCQGELPTLDAKEVRGRSNLREDKILASFKPRMYPTLITVH